MTASVRTGSKSWWIGGALLLIASACAAAILVQPSSLAQQSPRVYATGPLKFRTIEQVVDNWSADQHLYVQGDIGVAGAQLAELEQWLDVHGPHWTVVLMHDAQNQTFTTADGRQYSEMDAVEYALGHGLNNRTGFGKLEHPKTHEADGTVFVLFLEERKFSYYASAAQDRRKLGAARWIGELDQPAVRAMQTGGRILDAVKDTVTSIDGKLDQAIEADEAAATAEPAGN